MVREIHITARYHHITIVPISAKYTSISLIIKTYVFITSYLQIRLKMGQGNANLRFWINRLLPTCISHHNKIQCEIMRGNVLLS